MTIDNLYAIAKDSNSSAAQVWEVLRYMSRSFIQEHGPKDFNMVRIDLITHFRNNPARELWTLEDPCLYRAIFNR